MGETVSGMLNVVSLPRLHDSQREDIAILFYQFWMFTMGIVAVSFRTFLLPKVFERLIDGV